MTLNANQIFTIIPTALITIIAGSYFVFHAVFTSIINLLLKRKKFSYRGIRIFTLGQLKFRLHSYTRVLTMISLLFALALGAITVGMNFNSLRDQVADGYYYDTVVVSSSKPVKKGLAKLAIKSRQTYHFKTKNNHVYFQKAEFAHHPLKTKEVASYNDQNGVMKMRVATVAKVNLAPALSTLYPNNDGKITTIVSQKKWRSVKGQPEAITLIRVKDFARDFPQILHLEQLQLKKQPQADNIYRASKANAYQAIVAYSSGFEFMGFFLGLAFLTMLASTLMFKVLSGAYNDRQRYRMLTKMGTRAQLLRSSIKWEIGSLFTLPAILGIIDVLFGLKLFRGLILHPYRGIWLPFTIFIILYLFYYALTVKLYEKIVLSK